MIYDGEKIIEQIECEYLRNNLKVRDIIYIIITKNMKNNLLNYKIDTIYIDCTYKIVPPGFKNYKFLVIIGFDKGRNKLLLYLYSLIRHENTENFTKILN